MLVRRFMGIDAEDRDPARGQLVQRRAADRTETDDDDICRALHGTEAPYPHSVASASANPICLAVGPRSRVSDCCPRRNVGLLTAKDAKPRRQDRQ